MNKLETVTKPLMWLMALLLVAFVVGCKGGSEGGNIGMAKNSNKAFTSYSILGNTGTINESAKIMAVTVPSGTALTALVATFTTTGSNVKVGTTAQTSGTTPNNFTNPVAYIVTATDGTTATYSVVVTVAATNAKAISTFSFGAYPNATVAISGTATPYAIAVTVPYGTPVTALVATFTSTGASVKVGTMAQTSGTTQNNFTSPVAYIVTAADGTTATYNVTVSAASATAKAMTSFSFVGYSGATGTITGTTSPFAIAVTVPNGTVLTGLVATFATTGTGVKVGTTTQTSGTTPNNFTSPVAYTVTAGDASTAIYNVTVTVAAAAATTTVLPGIAGGTNANATNPTVISAIPRNVATSVPTSTNSWNRTTTANVVTGTLVTATFNAAMAPATITPVGVFTLKETVSGNIVAGTVTMNTANTIATFTPTATALAVNTNYTATVSVAATSAASATPANTPMPKPVVWSFTTNATLLTGQAPVNLLTAGDFVMLANTAAVTYNGTANAAAVIGDVGIATLAASSIAGFSALTKDATGDFATAAEVVSPGKVYAPDYTGGGGGANGLTPAKMTAAGTDMTAAHTDGAGRTAASGAPFLNAGLPTVGTLDGLTLSPGVYTWGGSVISSVNSAGNVTLSGGPDDVWIFQIGGSFRPGNGSQVLLSNPAGGALPQPKNIFWVVAADITLGTTAHVEGILLSSTYITFNSGATANGRMLAGTAVTLGGTVTQPAP